MDKRVVNVKNKIIIALVSVMAFFGMFKIGNNNEAASSIQRRYTEQKTTFCIVDDDCRSEVISILKPMLDKREIKGTLACPTGLIGTNDRLTKSQLLELYKEGWEIISHSHTHTDLTTLSREELENELVSSKEFLKNIGIETNAIAYPHGAYNKMVIQETWKHYEVAMTSTYSPNKTPLPTYSLGRIGVGAWGFNDWESIKRRIDAAIKNKTICIIMTHIGDNTPEQNLLVEQTLDYILGLGYEITTFSEAYEKHKNILEYGDFNEATNMVDFAIGYDGSIGGNKASVKTAEPNAYLNDTPISDFPIRSVVVSVVTSEFASGFPFNAPGTLITSRMASDDFGYQLYKITWSDQFHFRIWDTSANSWSQWNYLNITRVLEDNAVNNDTPPSAFRNGVITYCRITWSNRYGFPTDDQGLLITNAIGAGPSSINKFQEYHTSASNLVYRRTSVDGDSWGPWQIVNAVVTLPVDSVTHTTPMSSFPNYQITYCRIRDKNASGFPENRGGLLTTSRIAGNEYYIWQEYEVVQSGRKYRRFWDVSTNEWSAWQRYVLENVK